MSELTPCNYCTLQWIKQRAKKAGNQVVVRKGGWFNGVDVFVVPPGIGIPEVIDSGDDKHNGDEFTKKYFCAWFMKLTDHCVC